jgi:hypothetical protein
MNTVCPHPTAQYGQTDLTTESAASTRGRSRAVLLLRTAAPRPDLSSPASWRYTGQSPIHVRRPTAGVTRDQLSTLAGLNPPRSRPGHIAHPGRTCFEPWTTRSGDALCWRWGEPYLLTHTWVITDERNRSRTAPRFTYRKSVVVGLLAAPGLLYGLALRLARELPDVLSARFTGFSWQFVVREELLAGAEGSDEDLVEVARGRLLDEGCGRPWRLPMARLAGTSMAAVGSALGAALEDNAAVREAAYGCHPGWRGFRPARPGARLGRHRQRPHRPAKAWPRRPAARRRPEGAAVLDGRAGYAPRRLYRR